MDISTIGVCAIFAFESGTKISKILHIIFQYHSSINIIICTYSITHWVTESCALVQSMSLNGAVSPLFFRDTAWELSPFNCVHKIHNICRNVHVLLANGTAESPEFIRQSLEYHQVCPPPPGIALCTGEEICKRLSNVLSEFGVKGSPPIFFCGAIRLGGVMNILFSVK